MSSKRCYIEKPKWQVDMHTRNVACMKLGRKRDLFMISIFCSSGDWQQKRSKIHKNYAIHISSKREEKNIHIQPSYLRNLPQNMNFLKPKSIPNKNNFDKRKWRSSTTWTIYCRASTKVQGHVFNTPIRRSIESTSGMFQTTNKTYFIGR